MLRLAPSDQQKVEIVAYDEFQKLHLAKLLVPDHSFRRYGIVMLLCSAEESVGADGVVFSLPITIYFLNAAASFNQPPPTGCSVWTLRRA